MAARNRNAVSVASSHGRKMMAALSGVIMNAIKRELNWPMDMIECVEDDGMEW